MKTEKPTNLRSIVATVPSILAVALSVLSIVCGLLAGLCMLYHSDSEFPSAEVLLVGFVYLVVVAFGVIFIGAGWLMGIVSTIVTLVTRRFKLIWIPVLAIALGVLGFYLMSTIGHVRFF